MCFLIAALKVVYGVFIGGCSKISLTSIAYSGDKEPTMYLNRVNSVVMFRVSNWDLTCVNYSCGSLGQNGGSFLKTAATDEAV